MSATARVAILGRNKRFLPASTPPLGGNLMPLELKSNIPGILSCFKCVICEFIFYQIILTMSAVSSDIFRVDTHLGKLAYGTGRPFSVSPHESNPDKLVVMNVKPARDHMMVPLTS